MAVTIIPINNPVFKIADTEAGLAAGDAYECQLTTASIIGTTPTNTVPATGCQGPTSTPGKAGWALSLAWLQDWTAPAGGLSKYAYDNETELKWFSLAIDNVGFPTVIAQGQAYVTPGQFGGVIGGPPAPATASWPILGKPAIAVPA